MLGRLFQSAASTFSQHGSSRPQTPLESVTEEAHTRDLLYPDVSTLRSSPSNSLSFVAAKPLANAREAADCDDRGGLDVAYPSDVRIIIAQDANSQYHQPQILYDSMPPQNLWGGGNASAPSEHELQGLQSRAFTRTKAKPGPDSASRKHHTPNSSIFQSSQIQPPSPLSPRSSASRFSNAQAETRFRTSPFEPPLSETETAQGRSAREAREDIDALLGCMFGAPGFRIEAGTKLHILPKKKPDVLNTRENDPNVARPLSSGGFIRRRTPLVRSTSIADIQHEAAVAVHGADWRSSNNARPCIMFTRLFSVQLQDLFPANAEGDAEDSGQAIGSADPDTLRSVEGDLSNARPSTNVKQKKVPMYAMSVILQLPADGILPPLKTPALHHALSSLGSSFNEVTPSASWNTEYSMFSKYMDMRSPGSQIGAETPLYGNVSMFLAHWSTISRSLELFELSVKSRLSDLLERSVPLAPLIASPPAKIKGSKPKKPKPPSQQSVHVQPACLQVCGDIQAGAEKTGQRIVGGLRTRRVATGQGRWGAWREEARWVGRWAGGRDQNFFFFNLMTAFLGYHTSWLESFGSFWLRGRHTFQPPNHDRSDDVIHQRTVIVSMDKMAARRLVFLLAAFLPDSRKPFIPPMLHNSNATNTYAGSPSSTFLARDGPSHHTMDKPASDTNKNNAVRNSHARSVSFSLLGAPGESEIFDESAAAPLDRRMSDTRSLRSVTLAIPVSSSEERKASTSTIIAESAIPVPHFTSLSANTSSADTRRARPGSSGSLASIALNHTLKRSDSTAMSTSGSGGRWGSMVSGFWSNRRASSTDESDALGTSSEGPTEIGAISRDRKPPAFGKLAQMVDEASTGSTNVISRLDGRSVPQPGLSDGVAKSEQDSIRGALSSARSILRKPKVSTMSLKMSFNEEDGYLDIKIPQLRSFGSSLESSFNSSRLQNPVNGDGSGHKLPHGLPATLDTRDARLDSAIDVAGWLKSYQADFVLQAVRPYAALKHDIKESMRSESRLNRGESADGSSASDGTWTDICSTLIADTTTFSIHRLTLRHRRVEVPKPSSIDLTRTRGSSSVSARQNSSNLASDGFEERFIEEPIMDMDPTLIDAVERILAQSGQSSRVHSRGPSPSRAGNDHVVSHSSSVRKGPARTAAMDAPVMELPHSECKNMVLGALEEVVRSVFAEQHQAHNNTSSDSKEPKEKEMPDSTLREGVRRWLLDIEDA